MDLLHLHTYGPADAPPLLLVHGVTGHGGRFRRLAQQQFADFRVLAPDLRGHGRSPVLPPWTLEQHAADLLAVLDDADIAAVAVAGHSFGGLVALHLARLAPQRVTHLAMLDPSVGTAPERALEVARGVQRRYADLAEIEQAQRAGWPFADDELIAAELAENTVTDEHGARYRYEPAAIAAACSELSRVPALPPPDLPTLLVHSVREEFVSPEYVKACELTVGDNFTHVGLDCGHMVYLEQAERTGELVRTLLAGTGG